MGFSDWTTNPTCNGGNHVTWSALLHFSTNENDISFHIVFTSLVWHSWQSTRDALHYNSIHNRNLQIMMAYVQGS